jgi:hypothetical protein
MRTKSFVMTAALAAVLAAAPLASAQNRQRWPSRGDNGNRGSSEQRGGGDNQRANGNGGDNQRANGSANGDAQRGNRQAQSRDGGRAEAPRESVSRDTARRSDNRDNNGRQDVTPQQRVPQVAQRDGNDRRADGRPDGRSDGRYAVPRTGPAPRYRDGDRRVYVQPRSNYYVYRYPAYRYAPRYGYHPIRPGYYSYRYYDPYFVGDFYWTNYAWQPRSYYSGPNWDYGLGKLRLDIDQRDAEVYIDGYYAGVVDEFDGVLQGLRLEPGHYGVEVALPGFAPLQFDVQITPGRTTTYRGALLPEPYDSRQYDTRP